MKFHYDLTGAEPIIRDVLVYDAAALAVGEMVMLGTTSPGSADSGVAFVTAYTGSSAEAVDALGVLCEADAVADTAAGSGGQYLKCIINPFAIYLAEYDQDTAVAFTSSTTTVTMTGTSEDNIDAGWMYAVTAAVSGNERSIRFITAAASGSFTINAALTGGDETAGTLIKIHPINHALTALNTAATKLKNQAAAGSGVSLRVLENYVSSPDRELQPLRYATHRSLDQLSSVGTKLYADIVMIDHIFNPNV